MGVNFIICDRSRLHWSTNRFKKNHCYIGIERTASRREAKVRRGNLAPKTHSNKQICHINTPFNFLRYALTPCLPSNTNPLQISQL